MTNDSRTGRSVFGRLNPSHSCRRDDNQPIQKFFRRMVRHERQQQGRDSIDGGRVRLDPNDTEVLGQWQHHPIAEVAIRRDQSALVRYGAVENERGVGSGLASFRGSQSVMSVISKQWGELRTQALVQVEAHGRSSRSEFGHLGMQNGMTGVHENRSDIRSCQLRIALEERVPRFAFGKLLKNGGHRNTCSFNDRLSATDPRIDFNAVAHF